MDVGDMFEIEDDLPDIDSPMDLYEPFPIFDPLDSGSPTLDPSVVFEPPTTAIGLEDVGPVESMRSTMEDLKQDDVIGTPETDIWFWEIQTTGFTCAVQAQRGIIEMFTGDPISESQLVYEATTHGWLTDAGMSPFDVGNLLELHGIDCHSQSNATVEQLMAELASGHKVIIGVDSGELWGEDSPLEDFFQEKADHAVWVTGVDLTDPDNPKVIINDSGTSDGAGKSYDLKLFVDAWEDSGFDYVATNKAPVNLGDQIDGFDTEIAGFTELINWLGDNFGGFWDYLNSPDGRTDVAEATETITGIAGLIFAADLLIDSVADLLNDADTNAVFQML